MNHLSLHQQLAFRACVDLRQNVAILGKAGSGKSFLIQAIREAFVKRNVVVQLTALTGLAATLLPNAVTLHSFLGAGMIQHSNIEALMFKICSLRHTVERLKAIDCLIIDEVSMMDALLLHLLHLVLQRIHWKMDKPFGGIQVIVVGDFAQLPPILKQFSSRNTSQHPKQLFFESLTKLEFCFQHPQWKEFFPVCVCLEEIFRQNDPIFIQLLNRIRMGKQTRQDLQLLKDKAAESERLLKKLKKNENLEIQDDDFSPEVDATENIQCVYEVIQPQLLQYMCSDVAEMVCQYLVLNQLKDYVFLHGINREVDLKNAEALQKLIRVNDAKDTHTFEYRSRIQHTNEHNLRLFQGWIEEQKRSNLAKPSIVLTKGAKVMLTCNLDIKEGLVNGKIGHVVGFENNTVPLVEFQTTASSKKRTRDGDSISWSSIRAIQPHEWFFTDEIITTDNPIMNACASYTQVPLRLAWNISCHKSQGATLSHISLNAKNIWAPGQFYVALSRAQSLRGVLLINFSSSCIRTHPEVVKFYEYHERETEKLILALRDQNHHSDE